MDKFLSTVMDLVSGFARVAAHAARTRGGWGGVVAARLGVAGESRVKGEGLDRADGRRPSLDAKCAND
jgi:hypothetical protein